MKISYCDDSSFLSLLSQGMVLKDGAKMSKSKGNTIDPDEIINKYGHSSDWIPRIINNKSINFTIKKGQIRVYLIQKWTKEI